MVGAGLQQLVPAAVAVQHADALHAVVFRADHVVAAIADHQGVGRIDRDLFQRVFEQMRLVHAGAVEFGTKHALEVIAQPEMIDDALGEHMRLAGGDEQPVAGGAERGQHVADAVVDAVLIEADVGKSLDR